MRRMIVVGGILLLSIGAIPLVADDMSWAFLSVVGYAAFFLFTLALCAAAAEGNKSKPASQADQGHTEARTA